MPLNSRGLNSFSVNSGHQNVWMNLLEDSPKLSPPTPILPTYQNLRAIENSQRRNFDNDDTEYQVNIKRDEYLVIKIKTKSKETRLDKTVIHTPINRLINIKNINVVEPKISIYNIRKS